MMEVRVIPPQPFVNQHADLPVINWCEVPAGEVTLEHDDGTMTYTVEAFQISKYPVTNAQYRAFLEAADGYRSQWVWEFSSAAREWHYDHSEPLEPKFADDLCPRVNICWYEATAYCRWLSARTGLHISLPTEYQWQRAAQGESQRPYPWGDAFDLNRCNTLESHRRTTTPVDAYPGGVSPYGVYDLLGNVWEWCSTWRSSNENSILEGEIGRVVRGGAFVSPASRVNNHSFFILKPVYRYVTIGFRLVCNP